MFQGGPFALAELETLKIVKYHDKGLTCGLLDFFPTVANCTRLFPLAHSVLLEFLKKFPAANTLHRIVTEA